MNQPFSEELLSAYLDGELSSTQRKDVEQRLQSDPAAQRQFADFQKLSHLLRDLPTARPPGGFADQVMLLAERNALLREPLPAAAAAAPAAPARRSWLKPTLGIVAAAAAVVFIVQTVPLPGPDQKSDATVAMEFAPAGAGGEAADMHAEEREAETLSMSTLPAVDDKSAGQAGQNSDGEGQAEPSAKAAVVEAVAPAPADAIAKKRILQDGPWDSSRIGEVIDVARTDRAGNKIMVFKAVVTNIDKWVGGTDVDVIGLNQSGPPSTIAVHIEATPAELATFVAKLSEDGQQLLTFEPGTPVTLASLPQESRKSFAWSLAKPNPAAKEAEGQSTKSSQFKIRSHTAPTTFGDEESAQSAPAVADSNLAETVTADETKNDSGEKATPSPAGRARRAGVPLAKKPLVTKVPVVLEEQLLIVEHAPPLRDELNLDTKLKDEGDADDTHLKITAQQPRLKVILLVRQKPPVTPAETPEKKAGDGGGAA